MEQKLSDTLVKAIDRSNPFMQNLQLASRFNKLVEQGGGDLEDNKEISITENGTVEITPTEGKDGMKKVTADVNIPPSYTLETLSLNKDSEPVTIPYEGKSFVFLGKMESWGALVGIGGTPSKLLNDRSVNIENTGAVAGRVSNNTTTKTLTYTPDISYSMGSVEITKLIIQ